MYWPFTYEVKLTVMKETENCTCRYIATKSKSGTLYVWNNARCPCRSRLKLDQRLKYIYIAPGQVLKMWVQNFDINKNPLPFWLFVACFKHFLLSTIQTHFPYKRLRGQILRCHKTGFRSACGSFDQTVMDNRPKCYIPSYMGSRDTNIVLLPCDDLAAILVM